MNQRLHSHARLAFFLFFSLLLNSYTVHANQCSQLFVSAEVRAFNKRYNGHPSDGLTFQRIRQFNKSYLRGNMAFPQIGFGIAATLVSDYLKNPFNPEGFAIPLSESTVHSISSKMNSAHQKLGVKVFNVDSLIVDSKPIPESGYSIPSSRIANLYRWASRLSATLAESILQQLHQYHFYEYGVKKSLPEIFNDLRNPENIEFLQLANEYGLQIENALRSHEVREYAAQHLRDIKLDPRSDRTREDAFALHLIGIVKSHLNRELPHLQDIHRSIEL